jgi:hypothetical protein
MPERKAADLASLVSEAARVLVEPWPAQDLHPSGTALVWCRGGDDASRVEILSL